MPLNIPSSVSEVIDRTVNDVFLALQEFGAKPSLRNSWINSLIVGFCNRVFDFYFALNQATLEVMPDTADDFLYRWAAIYNVRPLSGSVARGSGCIVANSTNIGIPLDATWSARDGTQFKLVDNQIPITKFNAFGFDEVTRSGTTASATTNIPHNLSDNVKLQIVGWDQNEYNGTGIEVTVTGTNTFEYQVEGSPVSPGTGGAPAGLWIGFIAELESVDFTDDANLDPLATIEFDEPLPGVDSLVGVTWGGLTGGLDQEEKPDTRARFLDRIQNPVAHFNAADIDFNAKKVRGVTRVWVREITPAVGQVTVYFVRDNDDAGPIPNGARVQEVKDALDLIRPANTDPEDLIVLAPTAVPTDFTFTSLSPDSTTMREAVSANLAQFFAEDVGVGDSVVQDAYRSVIFNTVDTTTGAKVQDFTLSEPTGAIQIEEGQLATLGTILFQ